MRIIAAMGEPPATRAAVEQFLAAPRLLYLGVTEPDGTPLVHPVWYTWEGDTLLVHLGTPSRKRQAIDRQPTVYFTIALPDGTAGVRGKATARLDPDRDRLRHVLQAQCARYARPPDSETYRLVFGLLATGHLVLAVLTPHYLATWGL
jgi:Pyridoxamine 5'-phosphate oxidase